MCITKNTPGIEHCKIGNASVMENGGEGMLTEVLTRRIMINDVYGIKKKKMYIIKYYCNIGMSVGTA